MTTYTLKLVSGVNYNLYNGATLVTDADLATLFGSAGSAFFVFDFDGGTPTNTTDLTIVDSNSQAVITNTGLSGIAENTNFNGDWSASATAFDTFVKSPAAVLDEAQMSDLMGKIKGAEKIPVKTINTAGTYKLGDLVNELGLVFAINPTVANVKIKGSQTTSTVITLNAHYMSTFVLGSFGSYGLFLKGGISNYMYVILDGYLTTASILNSRGIVDGLGSTSSTAPLSANQGRILNNNIGDLTTLTTTTKTSAVVAINEVNAKVLTNAGAPTTSTVGTVGQLLVDTTNGKLYICTDATNPYVWEEVGAGGGIQNALIIREWS